MSSLQAHLAKIIARNHSLAKDIDKFAQTQQRAERTKERENEKSNAETAAFLDTIYTTICSMRERRGHPRTTNQALLAAWTSFFDPIRSLTGIPDNGNFLAARMTLYLTAAFLREGALQRKFPETASSVPQVAKLHSFLVAIDEQLLSYLRNIWKSNGPREEFLWVFSPYPVNDASQGMVTTDAHRSQVLATDPAVLAACGGISGRRIWMPEPGSTPLSDKDPSATLWSYKENSEGQREMLWQQYGDDGPIREDFFYSIVNVDTGNEELRTRQVLRRSKQFVLDARQVAQPYLARDRYQLASHILDASPLAMETEVQILSYFDEPAFDPYLSHLDLAEVYSPFPAIDKTCVECTEGQPGHLEPCIASLSHFSSNIEDP
ncbi:hypothetical protein A1O1_09030 [Capronia coronata CBS 617.96]|uniref:Uncharacterized protein n=1 Tax=Capronia coronata CBS 617.96 TaxID=1182541 RepID=W9Y895_9EURO|nr:uncharacterized protein A1O1_09030 [Capronia coronata CBS 617.96]EXJ78629.1 hypothetical protein A1O1_09030 [Capronia coronata CBS 617.96]